MLVKFLIGFSIVKLSQKTFKSFMRLDLDHLSSNILKKSEYNR